MNSQPSIDSTDYPRTAVWFIAGGAVTAVFSGSLSKLTHGIEPGRVLAVCLIVPSFTWLVQLIASGIALGDAQRRAYWRDLGHVCFVGSVALLPAAVVNLVSPAAPKWPSVANVLVSVVLMGACLFRRTAQHGIGVGWPMSWCLTIAVNMAIFAWLSWSWWYPAAPR